MPYTPRSAEAASDILLTRAFERFVARDGYPCVGAKSALARKELRYFVGRDIRSAYNDLPLLDALTDFAQADPGDAVFRSFVAIFELPVILPEIAFERALWDRMQSLHDKDRWLGQAYDPAVSSDPSSPDFSLSVGGEAFFVVGLHSRSSRRARRFRYPTLVFNLHSQFDRLRADGRYHRMRDTIILRDEAYSGSINPMLAEHGVASEARQYSGREVGAEWVCPFQANTAPRPRILEGLDRAA